MLSYIPDRRDMPPIIGALRATTPRTSSTSNSPPTMNLNCLRPCSVARGITLNRQMASKIDFWEADVLGMAWGMGRARVAVCWLSDTHAWLSTRTK
ncbi:hypothetical protein M404DRAFT_1002085 [Pisolithus tinctorius Marx 270]|uniref:Uncharacterized protein n=1 Tax=Pisolithus tinctorius Marx 270 TaxID=870435 RepID=A0A0C3P5T3_PISTI|nr:hypothetical protein M404DRAFT_1002077 [Pisolithus tinctorius Marx 270]KIO02851.1 hypothetical protein M404DRAFT_1002085 [Pisolithus tinctorius Marx 270]